MTSTMRLIAVCAVLVLATPTSAEAAGPPEPLIAGLRLSDEISGPALAAGQILDEAGRPSPGRAVAVAWPTAATMAVLADGDPVYTLPVAQALAGPDGTFALRVDPRLDLAEYTEPDGTINLDLRVQGDAGTGLYGFSRRLSGGPSPRWLAPGTLADPSRLVVRLERGGGGPTSADAESMSGTCPDYLVATYNHVHVDVGESYSGPTNRAQFSYEVSQTSNLGIGISVGGALGSFSVSGTMASANSAGNLFALTPYNTRRLYQTGWQYRKIDIWQGYYTCSHWRYEVRPILWQADFWEATPSATPGATNCSSIPPGSAPYKVAGTARTLTAGAKLSSQIGNNLSSQTGFTAKTRYDFPFNSSGGRLCGSNASWQDASAVVGKGP